MMETTIGAVKLSLNEKNGMVTVDLPGHGSMQQVGVQAVLMFGILVALQAKCDGDNEDHRPG